MVDPLFSITVAALMREGLRTAATSIDEVSVRAEDTMITSVTVTMKRNTRNHIGLDAFNNEPTFLEEKSMDLVVDPRAHLVRGLRIPVTLEE